MDDLGSFGQKANILGRNPGKNMDSLFPLEDIEDLRSGATYIPGQVTDARRDGWKVAFLQHGPREQWYWEFVDGTRIFHG